MIEGLDSCFSEMGSAGACAGPFVGFVGFKMNMSSSLGVAATVALAAVCVEGGLETIEAQDFIECNKYKYWNAINYCFNIKKINLSFFLLIFYIFVYFYIFLFCFILIVYKLLCINKLLCTNPIIRRMNCRFTGSVNFAHVARSHPYR